MTEFLNVNYAIFIGLAFGTFFNVVADRVPQGMSIVFPASHCPTCKHPIAVRDNIPVLSFLVLRGKCRYCSAPIPQAGEKEDVTCSHSRQQLVPGHRWNQLYFAGESGVLHDAS